MKVIFLVLLGICFIAHAQIYQGHLPKGSIKMTPDGRVWGNKERNDSLFMPIIPIDSAKKTTAPFQYHDLYFDEYFD